MLIVDNVTVQYGNITALKNVSFTARTGEIVTIIGSNGAGKSTLLNAITGTVPVSKGTISLDGNRISNIPSHRLVRLGLGYVPEDREIFGSMSVMDNLILGAYSARTRTLFQFIGNVNWFTRNKTVNENLKRVLSLFPRLQERKNQQAASLSGGEQQMLAIGRALMLDPWILVLDEPSLGLAPQVVREIMQLFVKLRSEGLGILLVEQDAVASLKIADRAVVLEQGSIALEGLAKDIIKDDRVTQAYLGKTISCNS